MKADEAAAEDAVGAIKALDREFMESVAAKDAARVAAFYTDDARILMPGQPVINGKSGILAFWKASLGGPVQSITLDTTHIEVSGNLAYAFGSNRILLKEAGEVVREEQGKYVAVYRREPAGGWKVVADSYSND